MNDRRIPRPHRPDQPDQGNVVRLPPPKHLSELWAAAAAELIKAQQAPSLLAMKRAVAAWAELEAAYERWAGKPLLPPDCKPFTAPPIMMCGWRKPPPAGVLALIAERDR